LHTASLSFSGTSHALEILHNKGNLDRAPSVETCIQWEMKIGLHKLTRPKVVADDWIWIMDQVVNKGVHKCFLVLGVRMSMLEERKDLTLRREDLEPLGVVPMRVSNGKLVAEELEKVLAATGGRAPLAILKDQGSDLRCGGRDFCREVRDIVRREGVSRSSYELISDHLLNIAILPRAEQFACDILDFLEKEGEKIPEGKRVLGSSEIIESVFGVHKNVSGRGPKPMGRLVLSMASRVAEEPSEELIAEAFERVQERTVDSWIAQAFSKGTTEHVDFMEEKWNHFSGVAQGDS